MGYCGPRGIALDTFLSWPQSSQDAALEWVGYEARRCQSCGSHPDEGPRHAHIRICSGCIARDQAAKEAREEPGAHVLMAPGRIATCEQCTAEREANAAPRR
jgi:hypothetical protein